MTTLEVGVAVEQAGEEVLVLFPLRRARILTGSLGGGGAPSPSGVIGPIEASGPMTSSSQASGGEGRRSLS